MRCRSCGRELRADVKRCPYCGTPVNTDEKRDTKPISWELQEDGSGRNSRNGSDLDIDWGKGRIVDRRTGQVYSRSENKWTEPEDAAEPFFSSADGNERYQKELDRQVHDITMDFGMKRRPVKSGMSETIDIGRGFRDADDAFSRSYNKKNIERENMWNLVLDDSDDYYDTDSDEASDALQAEFPEVEEEQIVLDDEQAFIQPEFNELKNLEYDLGYDPAHDSEYGVSETRRHDGHESSSDEELTDDEISDLLDNPEYIGLLYGKPDYSDLLQPDMDTDTGSVRTEPKELNVEMPDFMRDENKESEIEDIGSISNVEKPALRTLGSYNTEEDERALADFKNLIHAEDRFNKGSEAHGKAANPDTMELTSEERAKAENAEKNSRNLSMMPDIKFMSIEDEYEHFRQGAARRSREHENDREVNIKINEPTGARYTVKTKEINVSQPPGTGKLRTKEVDIGELKGGPRSLQVSVEVEDTRGSASVEVTRNHQGNTQVRTVTGLSEHEYSYDDGSIQGSAGQTFGAADDEAEEEDPLAFWDRPRESIPRMTITDIFGPEARKIIEGLDNEDGKQPADENEEKKSFRETMGIPADVLRENADAADSEKNEEDDDYDGGDLSLLNEIIDEGSKLYGKESGTSDEKTSDENSDTYGQTEDTARTEETDDSGKTDISDEDEEETDKTDAIQNDAADNVAKTVVINASDLDKLSQGEASPDVLSAKTIDISHVSDIPDIYAENKPDMPAEEDRESDSELEETGEQENQEPYSKTEKAEGAEEQRSDTEPEDRQPESESEENGQLEIEPEIETEEDRQTESKTELKLETAETEEPKAELKPEEKKEPELKLDWTAGEEQKPNIETKKEEIGTEKEPELKLDWTADEHEYEQDSGADVKESVSEHETESLETDNSEPDSTPVDDDLELELPEDWNFNEVEAEQVRDKFNEERPEHDLDWSLNLDLDDDTDAYGGDTEVKGNDTDKNDIDKDDLKVLRDEADAALDVISSQYNNDTDSDTADEDELDEDARALMAEMRKTDEAESKAEASAPQVVQVVHVVQTAPQGVILDKQPIQSTVNADTAVRPQPVQSTVNTDAAAVPQLVLSTAAADVSVRPQSVQSTADSDVLVRPQPVQGTVNTDTVVRPQPVYVQDEETEALMAELEGNAPAFSEHEPDYRVNPFQSKSQQPQDDLPDISDIDTDIDMDLDLDADTGFETDFNAPGPDFHINIDDDSASVSDRTDETAEEKLKKEEPKETGVDIDSLPPAERKAALKRKKEAEKERKKAERQQAANFNFDSSGNLAKVVRVILIILIIAVLLEFTVIGIKLFAPDSEAAVFIERLEEVVPFLKTDTDMFEQLNMDTVTAETTEDDIDNIIEKYS